jgi:hypothetical protein
MIQSIHTWFSSLDWDMWGGLGQWAGAIATFIAVLIALKQTKISQKQTEASLEQTKIAIQQLEDARRRGHLTEY